ncbi:MAG: isoprenylcysteine carboxylmethyltransferase family protein [Armatimonadota bacterium]
MNRSTANWLFVTPIVIAILLLTKPTLTGGNDRIDEVVDLLGLGIAVMGLVIRVVSRDWKSSHIENGLVTTGPYSIVRHPMYVASYLVGLGLLIIIGNLVLTLVFTVFYILVHVKIGRREERFLSQKWPEDYKSYKAKVPAVIPFPAALAKTFTRKHPWVSSRKAAVRRESGTIFSVVSAAILFEVREDYFVEGWVRAHTEITFCLALAALILFIWFVFSVIWHINKNTTSSDHA